MQNSCCPGLLVEVLDRGPCGGRVEGGSMPCAHGEGQQGSRPPGPSMYRVSVGGWAEDGVEAPGGRVGARVGTAGAHASGKVRVGMRVNECVLVTSQL